MLVPDESSRFRVRVAIALMPAMVVAFVLLARTMWSRGDAAAREAAVSPHGAGDDPGDLALPPVRLVVPSGVFRNPPGLFLWEPVPGAASYRVTVSDQDMIWPLARREETGTRVFFSTGERRAWSAPRRYSWLVEAFGADPGNLIARGEGTFAIGEPPLETIPASPGEPLPGSEPIPQGGPLP